MADWPQGEIVTKDWRQSGATSIMETRDLRNKLSGRRDGGTPAHVPSDELIGERRRFVEDFRTEAENPYPPAMTFS